MSILLNQNKTSDLYKRVRGSSLLTVTEGDFVFFNSDMEIEPAIAIHGKSKVCGYAIKELSDNYFIIQVRGVVKLKENILIKSNTYYLSTMVAGKLQINQPTMEGTVIKVLGFAEDTNVFNLNLNYVSVNL